MRTVEIFRNALSTALITALSWLLIALFNVFFWTLTILIIPFVMIKLRLQRLAPSIFGAPDDPNPEDVETFNLIWEDLSSGDTAALEAHAAEYDHFPHGVDPFIGRHWLTNAVDSGSEDAVRWILAQGVDPDFMDDEGNSPLISAVSPDNENATALVTLLLDHGAEVNYRVTLDRTALHAAACMATPDVVRLLLERGADPFAYDSDYVPAQPIADARSCKKRENEAVLREWMEKHPNPAP